MAAIARVLAAVALCAAAVPSFSASLVPLPGADGQVTRPVSAFPNPIGVTVFDDTGQPAVGVRVRFTTRTTGPTLVVPPEVGANGFMPMTNAQGVAILAGPPFTASSETGTIVVKAEALGTSAEMTLRIEGTGAVMTDGVSGFVQTTPVNAAFPIAPVARAMDGLGGNPVPRARCGISKSPVGASGTFASAPAANGMTAYADDNGFVTSPDLIANGTPGEWQLTINCGTTTSGQAFSLTNTSLGAVRITPGGPYAIATKARKTVEVTVRDAAGAPIAGRAVQFEYSYLATSGFLVSRSAVTDDRGVARTDVIADIEPGWLGIRAIVGDASAIVHVSFGSPAFPRFQDMWWGGPVENGWGLSIVQHFEKLFAVIYGYDNAGAPTWWVIPDGTWNEKRTVYTGAAYSPRGSAYYAYDATRFRPGSSVGNVVITFAGERNATLAYTINGISGTRPITRQRFGVEGYEGVRGTTEMWWGGASQDGWGLTVIQQEQTLFPVWFTYDAAGVPVWYIMPGGTWGDGGYEYTGRLFRTTSSSWLGGYNAAALKTMDVGSFRINFRSPVTFEYTADGKNGTMPISPLGF
ncbi:hypothetical protein DSM104443_00610 [Usitatibacter rugosus]|uniref:Big-1 domain-containing protein n=1 Tax=Usitatibacter rugosus TaxID=2732067 RepID=A0A6M4GQP0_9PROT|nr:Ig-like domain-containing protein [Usitatibacter rugosus]QJR09561.1 hypothetical protein DSM104443_00610 [Usitatibacter rugosus]